MADLQNNISINLSKNIPYKLKIDKNNALILSKGVMEGTIPIDSIILELVAIYRLKENDISFFLSEENEVIITIYPSYEIDKEEILQTITNLISHELPNRLRNVDTKNPLIYLTEELIGFPLIGSLYFGVIDRGTNLLQVRSITGCPLNCPFCSVDEGPASKTKLRDFIVDPDYLIKTYSYIVKSKGVKKIEAHLDGQGEPMSYPYLIPLIQELNEISETNIISIQTNGWYLTEELIDELSEAGLNRINLSINSLELAKAKRLAGRGNYPLDKILQLAENIVDSKINLLLAPVWIPNVNDEDIIDIIKFSKKVNTKDSPYPKLGIQNYLSHPDGRNVKKVKQRRFSSFYKDLRELEKELQIKDLILTQNMFKTNKTKMIENPMELGERIKARIILPGRLENEVLAVAKNRVIQVMNAPSHLLGKEVTLKISRNKHNIFFGSIV